MTASLHRLSNLSVLNLHHALTDMAQLAVQQPCVPGLLFCKTLLDAAMAKLWSSSSRLPASLASLSHCICRVVEHLLSSLRNLQHETVRGCCMC